jgi:hypothetical protein
MQATPSRFGLLGEAGKLLSYVWHDLKVKLRSAFSGKILANLEYYT